MDSILSFIVGSLMMVGSFLGLVEVPTPTPEPTLGAFNPTGGGTYRLQTSLGSTDTSIRLSSFKEPVSNISYTMSYLNTDIAYGTLDPQTNRSEFVSFTGITQNSDGTATLTGVTRGLSRSYPYTASTTLRQAHPGQSIFILSDSPQLFNEYAAKKNDETITGSWSFPDPTIPANPATKAYVDGTIFGGIGNASEVATGTVQIATQVQAASSTQNGSLGRLALPASMATSSYNAATAPLRVVLTENNGLIDPAFIFNGLDLFFPSTQGASSTALLNNGSGTLSWGTFSTTIAASSSPLVINPSTASSTVLSATIPANTLGTYGAIRVPFPIQYSITNGSQFYIEFGYGGSTTTLSYSNSSGSTQNRTAMLQYIIKANGATNAQRSTLSALVNTGAVTEALDSAVTGTTRLRTMTVDSTQDQLLLISIKTGNASDVATTTYGFVESLRR